MTTKIETTEKLRFLEVAEGLCPGYVWVTVIDEGWGDEDGVQVRVSDLKEALRKL